MKRTFSIILMFSAVFSISVLTTDLIQKSVFENNYENIVTDENNSSNEYKYRVSVFNGKLAVFEGNSKIPYKVYDTYVNSLPENDIRLLSDGIKTNSSSELMKIIEEYTS